jgi:hypothetical protein
VGEAVMVGEAAVTDLAGDFMVASPVTVLAGHSVWEGTQWVGGSTAVVETSTAGDFMAASPVTVLAGHSVWEGTQQGSLIFPGHPDSLADSDLMMCLCVRAAVMKYGVMTMAASAITTLGAMGIPEIMTDAIIAISSAILISLPSVFLIGGTLITDTSTTDTPIKMRTMILDRLTVTSIGKIWR